MDVIIKVLIEFDENKVLREEKYDLNKMKKYVDDIFHNCGVEPDENGMYVSKEWESIAAACTIIEEEGFVSNMAKWIWYRSNDGGNYWYENDLLEEIEKGKESRC
ncbi:MAG: hypothetical protein IJ079_03580 [Lachnospiraceae bacterium]|nr:hypothetical protein [Lachnospiraceae bacterium]